MEVVALRQEFLASQETRRVVCLGILLLVVLQDAPQHARRVMTTLRELRVEAQHVVEEHSVDDNMDEEEAYGKDVEMDEVEDTYKGEAPLVRRKHFADAVHAEPGEGMEVGSRFPVDTDDDENTEVGGRDEKPWLGCMVQMASGAG